MKLFKVLVAALLAPLLLIASANADDETKKPIRPSLTYYYFDG